MAQKTYKLHELIVMANAGKKFKAHRGFGWVDAKDLVNQKWPSGAITDDWTVQFEPEVVEFERYVDDTVMHFVAIGSEAFKKLKHRRWKFVATEVIND